MSVHVEELHGPVSGADRAGVLALEIASQQRPLGWDALAADIAGADGTASDEADAVTLVARDGAPAGARDGARPGVVGHASARRMVDEVHVLRLVVAPTHRRAGVGRALLEGLIAWAERTGAARVMLEVRAGNAAALALYRRAGFVLLGTRRGYYPDGEDAQVCIRELVPAGGR
jgi:[ribosomal protein S18]-alanine N-acetyltransferase